MRSRTMAMLADRSSSFAKWLEGTWDNLLGLGSQLTQKAVGPIIGKEDLDDALVDLERAGWISRGAHPEPNKSQVALASLTYGGTAPSAYPTHFGWAPEKSNKEFAAWRENKSSPGVKRST